MLLIPNEYNNDSYSTNARCIGSLPNAPSQDIVGYFTSNYSYMEDFNGTFKEADTNYKLDMNQMEKLNIQDIDEYYCLASRCINSNSGDTKFGINTVNDRGKVIDTGWGCRVDNSKGYGMVDANNLGGGLRPVFMLKSEIKVTGGSGTEQDPYTLGI